MIEYRWKTNRTEENGIEAAQLLNSIRGHHRTAFQVTLTTPVEMFPLEGNIESPGYCL